MIAPSLSTRGINFAYLFGPPRFVERKTASNAYDAVCHALKVDDFSFTYTTTDVAPRPDQKGFKATIGRKEGRGQFSIVIENPSVLQPMRLLVVSDFPPSLNVVGEQIDLAVDAVLGVFDTDIQKVLAEARLRAQAQAPGGDATKFIARDFAKWPDRWLESLGQPLSYVGAKFEVSASRPNGNSLDNPHRELCIEVLREDRRSIYVELVSRWSQVPAPPQAATVIDVSALRPIDQPPSAYIKDTYDYLHGALVDLGRGDA